LILVLLCSPPLSSSSSLSLSPPPIHPAPPSNAHHPTPHCLWPVQLGRIKSNLDVSMKITEHASPETLRAAIPFDPPTGTEQGKSYGVAALSLEAVLAQGVMEEHACCSSQHAALLPARLSGYLSGGYQLQAVADSEPLALFTDHVTGTASSPQWLTRSCSIQSEQVSSAAVHPPPLSPPSKMALRLPHHARPHACTHARTHFRFS
jgi:hypothetical protein